ncbi:GNAT family N-acetyltransferase [Sphingobacterium paramultivorum]|uniref:GNAT family N-acetyltransferase n=1 Tax=Sphingobacterium paramultivorum TaxID=2886510 RepID=UPI00129C17D9|nr:GNAT family N-acetyltransferase [Sphingobacterium paramultivorum]
MNKIQTKTIGLTLRKGILQDLQEILILFSGTIETVCADDYNNEQIVAWISSVNNHDRWHRLIEDQYFIVAVLNQKIVGFASLAHGDYIDVLYVHKDFQRQGIAQQLYNALETVANAHKNTILTADVSKTAKPFFEANGFKVTAEQIQIRTEVEIPNYNMKKDL